MLARVDAPLARPEQAEAGAEPLSEQTAVAQSVEPATREASGDVYSAVPARPVSSQFSNQSAGIETGN